MVVVLSINIVERFSMVRGVDEEGWFPSRLQQGNERIMPRALKISFRMGEDCQVRIFPGLSLEKYIGAENSVRFDPLYASA